MSTECGPGSTLDVRDPSRIGEARRLARRLAREHGLGEAAQGRIELAATEAAANLVRHAGGGEMVLNRIAETGPPAIGWLPGGAVPSPRNGDATRPGIEILAIDRGPGIRDLGRALAGRSPGGGGAGSAPGPAAAGGSRPASLGQGLGVIQRQADEFDIHTGAAGTVLMARVWKGTAGGRRPAAEPAVEVGAVCVPKPGESRCGDAWALNRHDGRITVLVADGLGHGPEAATAGEGAIAALSHDGHGPGAALETIHRALRSTRGAAVAVAELDPGASRLRFAGVGNVQGAVVEKRERRGLVSLNGTVGYGELRVQEFEYPWPPGAILVLHSDGVSPRWHFDHYPGLASRHPAVIAGVLYRDHRRQRDDAAAVVVRRPAGEKR